VSRTWKSLSAAAAVLAIALGLFLPQIVLSLQDRRLADQTDTYETNPVKFYASRQVTDTLRLLAEDYSTLSLPAAYASMRTDQVWEAAQTFLEGLADRGLFAGEPESFAPSSVAPSLYYRRGAAVDPAFEESDAQEMPSMTFSKTSAVVWDCALSNEDGASVRMTVDDATGLVLSVSCWLGENGETVVDPETAREEIRQFAEDCVAFLSDYYGLEAHAIEYASYPDSAELIFLSAEQEPICLKLTKGGSAFSVWVA
jgi:hypothetical protein